MVQPKSRRLATEAYADTQKTQAIADATTKYGGLVARGQRGYTVDQSAGRTVKVWDYLNNREQLIYGDTGVRTITHPLITGGTTTLHRYGNNVYLSIQAMVLSAAGNVTIADLIPSGFRPMGYRPISSEPYWASEVERRGRCTGSGLQFQGIQAGDIQNILGSWVTAEPWPSSLPGTAGGGIPA